MYSLYQSNSLLEKTNFILALLIFPLASKKKNTFFLEINRALITLPQFLRILVQYGLILLAENDQGLDHA